MDTSEEVATIRGRSAEERREVRNARSRPLLESLKQWRRSSQRRGPKASSPRLHDGGNPEQENSFTSVIAAGISWRPTIQQSISVPNRIARGHLVAV